MSKFDYKAEGELNSQYLLDLLNDYLDKILKANNAEKIADSDYKINPKSNRFAQWFKHITKTIALNMTNKSRMEEYNRVLVSQHTKEIKEKLQIFLQTNVLSARQFFDLTQTLTAIKFDVVLPELESNRYKVIKQSEKQFLRALNNVKYLNGAKIDYVLFNPPVDDIKPFLSDKVSTHELDSMQLHKLITNFINKHHAESVNDNFEPDEIKFNSKAEDFYSYSITDSGIGEDVEHFIRDKMLQKLQILEHDEDLMEDKLARIKEIDTLLKQLKVHKIEQMIEKLIEFQTNQAQAKEVIDKCKDIINSSTISGKSSIFLVMDNLYYKLCKKCDTLIKTIKTKLQMVDKEKMFALLEAIEGEKPNAKSAKSSSHKGIATDLYDDDEPNEIHITEDDDGEAEDEVVIDE